MSSIIDCNINLQCISNRRTITIYHQIETAGNGGQLQVVNNNFTINLSDNKWGNLDFQPDIVKPMYITYVSKNAHNDDEMAVLTCDFIREGEILAPFYALTSHEEYTDLKYTCRQMMDINNVYFTIKNIDSGELVDNIIYDSGTILIALEFIRYERYDE